MKRWKEEIGAQREGKKAANKKLSGTGAGGLEAAGPCKLCCLLTLASLIDG